MPVSHGWRRPCSRAGRSRIRGRGLWWGDLNQAVAGAQQGQHWGTVSLGVVEAAADCQAVLGVVPVGECAVAEHEGARGQRVGDDGPQCFGAQMHPVIGHENACGTALGQ